MAGDATEPQRLSRNSEQESSWEVKSAYANAQIALGVLGAVALILGVILASRITRSVTDR
jgi:hypothetical protein